MYLEGKSEAFIERYNEEMAEIKAANRKQILQDYRTRLNLYLADENDLTNPIDHGFIDIEIDQNGKNPVTERYEPNYFTDKRIAVYTAIFGGYDNIEEPVTVPDNVDFFIFTDNEVPESSVWRKLEVDDEEHGLEDKSEVVKNRYFKMHPHVFFEDYDYVMYVDGNMKVMTDPSEFIERMNEHGIMFHNHYRVNCVYIETERCRYQGLAPDEEYDEHLAYLEEQGVPRKWGLNECSVIFTEMGNEMAETILEEWWEEYLGHTKRDQVNLPTVLWRHDIRPAEVSGLGNDVYSNYAIQRANHQMERNESPEYNYRGKIMT